ncbi:hypothetical protein B6D25_11310 [Micrococcus luteus]|nr:hypothetical protein B6D25_11310 [Micrococcus luteus]
MQGSAEIRGGHVPVPGRLRRQIGADRPAAPDRTSRQGRPFSDARTMVEAITCRCRCGTPWRDLPEVNGP